jgi:MFS family permease
MAILSSVFPVQRRGRAIGVYVAAVYVGLSVGPFAGGLLTQHLGWRSIFILMLPLGASSIFVSIKFIQAEWTDAQGQRLDWLGSLLYAAAICALIYGATLLPSANAWKIMAAGLVVLIAFVLQELRAPHPVFDLSLFKSNRTFTFSSLAALINYAATYAITFMISLYLQYIKGMTPQQAGTILFAQPVVMAFLSPLAGRLADRVEPRWIASTGMALTVLGLAGFSLIGPGTGNVYIVANLIVLGLGFGLFSSPNMSAIMGAVDQQYYGVASGTVATMRVLGQMSSMAIATVALSIFIGRDPIQPANYGLFIRSVHTVFTILALVCTAGVFFSLARGRLRR